MLVLFSQLLQAFTPQMDPCTCLGTCSEFTECLTTYSTGQEHFMVINLLAHLHLSHDLQFHGLCNLSANHHCHSIRFLLRLFLVMSPVVKAGEDSEQ